MSQAENAAATSSKQKRSYQKGRPMTDYERKRASLIRKSETHKNLNVYIQNSLKDSLVSFCEEDGLTQAEFIEQLLKQESIRRKELL